MKLIEGMGLMNLMARFFPYHPQSIRRNRVPSDRRMPVVIQAALSALLLCCILLAGCGPGTTNLEGVDYSPYDQDDWDVSTPEEQGIDPDLIATLYLDAEEVENLRGLLVIKNGYLIGEKYFHGSNIGRKAVLASVTKSYTSALVGIALDQGCLRNLDQKMIDFFPEYVDQIQDPRKLEITIRDMLQMRAGYPWEEFEPPYLDQLLSNNNWLPRLVEFPLTHDPGEAFGYSNLTAHLVAVIVARACDRGLLSYGQETLFTPLKVSVGAWPYDANGYYYGSGDISFTARDVAKFGLLYLNRGEFAGEQVLPPAWVDESMQSYSEGIYNNRVGRYFRDIGYGFFWWEARAGRHSFNYAWGHGGNLIVLLHHLDVVIVTTADPLHGIWGQEAWEQESAVIDLVGKFIQSLPD